MELEYYLPPGAQSDDDYDNKLFVRQVMEDKWDKVIEKYTNDIKYHELEIKGKETALHVAISNQCKPEVNSLVKAILIKRNERCLEKKNERGDTPLHLAAYRGFTDACELIIGGEAERKYLIHLKNNNGETPLFCAVLGYQKIVFVYLRQFCPLDLNIAIDHNRTSILHVAIEREMFDLAHIILVFYENLGYSKNNNNATPLEILATRTSAFKSGNRLSWWKKILYYCIPISLHDATTTVELNQQMKKNATIDNSFSQVNKTFYNIKTLKKKYKIRDSLAQSCRCKIKVFGWKLFLDRIPTEDNLVHRDLKAIKTIKKNHKDGHELLEILMKDPIFAYMGGGDNPEYNDIENGGIEDEFREIPKFIKRKLEGGDAQETKENKKMEDSANITGKDSTFFAVPKSGIFEIKEDPNSDKKYSLQLEIKNIKTNVKTDRKNTSYLIAASHGIVEIMSKLQTNIKSVINETNSNNENVLLLAVKNRQPHVVEMLLNTLPRGVFSHLNLQVDKNENTMLHLAADISFQREHSWMISGAAMQMMWDIKWYKYIKDLVPLHFTNIENGKGKFPSEIFKEQHKVLLEKSVSWMKETAESCSVVAALIAGVSFATSGSVPGGNKQTGEPALEGKPAFEGFAISSLIGLYFSVTALIMFLSILTSRKEIEDFHKSLPMKLLCGLSSLFVSIVAMFVSFCAGHFFVLTDQYTNGGILFYLYISICLPVTFYAAVQFPLFVDLINVILKKVPPPSVIGVHL